MRSLRIAHVADSHLGYRSSTIASRDEDFATSWISACRAIVEAKPDLILHAGDVFHRPNPSWSAVSHFLDGVALLADSEVPLFVISGNHDSSRITTKHTVFSILSGVVPFAIISYEATPQVHRVDELDVEIVLLSHQALLSKSLLTDLQDTIRTMGTSSYKILVAHGDVGDLEKSKEMGSVVIPDFVFDYPWSYIALGHLHLAQPHGRTGWYSGSIERCGWSDADASPAWTLTTLSDDGLKHEQRPLPHLRMIQLPDLVCDNDEDLDLGQTVLKMLKSASIPSTRSVAKIHLKGIHLFARRSLQSSLQRLVRTVYPNLVFQVEVDSLSSIWTAPLEAPQEKSFQRIEEMFQDFVESRTFEDPTIADQLMEIGTAALAKARAGEINRETS